MDSIDGRQTNTRPLTLKTVLVDFVVVLVLVGSVVGLVVFVPEQPPAIFARMQAVLALTLGVSVLFTLLIQAFRLGWHQALVSVAKYLSGLLGKKSAVVAALYLLGLLVCEHIGMAPELRSWGFQNPEFLSFFGIYSTLYFLFLATYRMGQRAAEQGKETPWEGKSIGSIFTHLKPFVLALAVPVYLVGLVVLEWLGVGPALSLSNLGSRDSWGFLAVYTVGFLMVPFVIALLVWVVFLCFFGLVSLFKAIGNSERWQRIRGARLSKKELEARLLEERAARDEIAKKWRIQKEGEQEGRIKQRQDEIAEFGPITARMLWWSPVLTFGAQAASFVTSYLGIRIYLGLRQENQEWFGFNLPTWIAELFSAGPVIRVSFMSNDVLAIAASFFMATLIWALSALAVGRVRRRQHIPFAIFFFVIGLGLASTYTAFIFWNGEVATSEQLRVAQRETDKYFVEMEAIDQQNINESRREIFNMETQARNSLLERQIVLLRGHLLELQGALDAVSQDFSGASGLGYFLASGKDFYETFLECEVEFGCLSNLRGRGEVAKSLAQNVEAFDNNLTTWEWITAERARHIGDAQAAALTAIGHLQSRKLALAQAEVSKVRAAIISAKSEDPAVIFGSIRSRLSVPIASEAPTKSQSDALQSLRAGIQGQLKELANLAADTREIQAELPDEIRLDQIELPLVQDIGLLSQVRNELDALVDERKREFSATKANLAALTSTILINSKEKRLVQRSGELFLLVNGSRDEVESLGNLDLRPIFAKLAFLQSDFAIQINSLTPSEADLVDYPTIDEFTPEVIALSIITHAHLSVVPLLIQIMLDFGYTLIVIVVASRLRSRRMAS